MKFDILTLFPEAFSVFFNSSIIGNAVKNGIISYECINFRDYAENKHKRVDDYTYGGGKGMLIKPAPIFQAYDDIVLKSGKRPKVIYMSPRGKVFNQNIARELSKEDELVILCGHYEGVDQRIIDELCDCELSIGDYVLTGGEIPAMVLCDCISRLVPGVLSSEESFTEESHYNGLLEYNQYTRPEIYNGIQVPDVLLSGNKINIENWRNENARKVTACNRPDIYTKKFNKEPDYKDVSYSINLIMLGADKIVKQEILLQLSKRNITCCKIIDENSLDSEFPMLGTVIIICGEYSVKADCILSCLDMSQALIQVLKPFSEKRIINFLLPKIYSEYIPAKTFVTPSELADEIIRYCCSCDDNRLIKECVLEEIEFVCSVPYDLYEAYSDLLKEYSSDRLFCIKSSNVNFVGKAIIAVESVKYNVHIFSVRSRVYGRLQLMYVEAEANDCFKLFDRKLNGKFKCYLR